MCVCETEFIREQWQQERRRSGHIIEIQATKSVVTETITPTALASTRRTTAPTSLKRRRQPVFIKLAEENPVQDVESDSSIYNSCNEYETG